MLTLRAKALSALCAATLVTSCMPAAALAATSGGEAIEATADTAVGGAAIDTADSAAVDGSAAFDRGLFYEEADDAGTDANDTSEIAPLTFTNLDATVVPRVLSDELKYFSDYESGNYDQGFSWGDNYHALGYYQFDNRYGLQDFLVACYNYDPVTYGMLGWLRDENVDIASEQMYDREANEGQGALTEIGQRVENSWHAAYAADPYGFARLQDGWQYQEYIDPAVRYLNGRGLNMDYRRDCIIGLVGGVQGLFGSGGWRQFVGGYFSGKNWPGAGLTGDMSDREFATVLCNYIVDHVAEFYPGQPQYHEGWQNRYRQELRDCLDFLGGYPADVSESDWYVKSGAYDFVTSHGYMNGYQSMLFGPYDAITRGQVVTVLWNMAGEPSTASEAFSDVDYGAYYGPAILWARAAGVVNGTETAAGNVVFRPDDAVTREELATLFANYAAAVDGRNTESSCERLDEIAGAGDVSGWARQAMGWAVDEGLISGVIDGDGVAHVDPQGAAWRASMASIVTEYLR